MIFCKAPTVILQTFAGSRCTTIFYMNEVKVDILTMGYCIHSPNVIDLFLIITELLDLKLDRNYEGGNLHKTNT